MTHPLVLQLRFTRSEFRRGLEGLTEEEAKRRFLPMNCISWNIGHLAWQEQRYWLFRGQDQVLLPEIQEKFAYGAPPSTPSLKDMWKAWEKITLTADPWLNTLTTEKLNAQQKYTNGRDLVFFTFGSLLQRVIYHYWYHTGENLAIRQMLGHRDLPEFVGNIDDEAPYTPE
jgi:DinB superfamily